MRPAILALALLTACTSCIFREASRSPAQQHEALVKITAYCSGVAQEGSGVLVADDLVLTANHVVSCNVLPGFPISLPADKIAVDAGSGPIEADLDVTVVKGDVARLKLARSAGDWYTPVRVGPPPGVGDKVCVVSAVPRYLYRCGEAQASPSGRIAVDARIEHGQSGSGMYDSSGRLVGIVTNLIYCEPTAVVGLDGRLAGQAMTTCMGFGTSLVGRAWLVPES